MTGTPNGAAAPDDDGHGIPADMISDEPLAPPAQPTPEEVAWKAEQEKKDLQDQIRAQGEMLRQLQAKDAAKDALLAEIRTHAKQTNERSQAAQERGWQFAVDEAWAAIDRAVETADKNAADAAKRNLAALMRNHPGAAAPDDGKRAADPPPNSQGQPDPAAVAWVSRNPWYNTDMEMRVHADVLDRQQDQSRPISERLKAIEEGVKKRFPEKFPTLARNNPPAVARPGPQGSRPAGKKSKTEADLPASARAAMERFVKQGVLTKEQYVKDYFEQAE